MTGMTTGKWRVTSDMYLPEEVGHGLCACALCAGSIFLPQQAHI